ncbi:hypothetical protein AB0J47_39840 [Nocardia sp. NPDC049737]|uniref:hypothetical protein n=1 Tax=Nocardia sp. NPDC049737 TaxID=3154358 RepID=UPI003427EFB8
MPENEVDQITREMRTLGQAATVAIGAWRRQNPGKTRVPRKVRKEAMRELRDAMRAHELLLASERRFQRASVVQMIANHRAMSLDLHRSEPGTPEQYAHAQWAHAQQRHNLALQIHSAGHLTREERGHAVMALVSAHYADNPNVKQRPVWGPKPYGMTALKARLAERVSRVQEGLEQRRENRSARKALQRPAAPSVTGLHQYWSNPMPPQDQAANARIAKLEQQLRDLAAERDLERDQLQVKLTQLGEKVLDARREHKSVADQLAQRGQELTDAHTELQQVRTERDAAVRKLIEHTPPQQRYGSPERQAEQARPTQAPKSQDASKAQQPPKVEQTPKAPEAPVTPAEPVQAANAPEAPEAPAGERKHVSQQVREAMERKQAGPTAPQVNDALDRLNKAMEDVPSMAQASRDLVGAASAARQAATQRFNGSRKVTGPGAPEIPLPPEPPTGLEPPEFTR